MNGLRKRGWILRVCARVAPILLVFIIADFAFAAGVPPRLPLVVRGTSPTRQSPYAGPLRGGSNFLWYTLGSGCDREPYGIVPNYHHAEVRSQVRAQLAAMFASGQARLSLGVYFAHGVPTGTAIDSSDPAAVAQAAQNVADLLADVKAAGFHGALFRFFPVGTIYPPNTDFDPSLMNEYWSFIQTIRPALVNAQLPYLIDLGVEALPRDSDLPFIPDPWKYPRNTNWSRAVRTLWQSYYAAYGAADTIGFSSLTDDDAGTMRSRVRHMRYVYDVGGGNPRYPATFAIDVYGDASANEAVKLTQFDQAMRREDPNGSLGWRDAPVIVAETYYDDPVSAENLVAAMKNTGRKVPFLTQWPLDRGSGASSGGNCAATNVLPPFTWSVYGHYGF
ncbi:MAG: hypothetical protein JSS59_07620 [Proteobacteria bacterium]|uniref:hypothetical protein n=1 Tax=Rudaea sp. TaxID=2136325 RepID=UPI003782EECB|nr:hypothetical protein [Pseudomonadota bacterium]